MRTKLSGPVVERVNLAEVRTYIPEKKRKGRRHWQGKAEQQRAVYQNRQRVGGSYGKSLLGTQLCALLRDRGDEAHASARTQEHSQATTDPRGGIQLEPDPAPIAGRGHAAGVEKSRWRAFFVRLFTLSAPGRPQWT